LKRRVGASSVALRDQPAELSSIVGSLVTGTEVEQIETLGDWVHVLTADRRDGWLREDELSPDASVPTPTLETERSSLHTELEAVENVELGTLVGQIDEIAAQAQAQAKAAGVPTGWEFATETAKVVLRTNYRFLAFIALGLYAFMWLPGFIMNVVFLKAANKQQRETNQAPEGKGCLVWLLWVFGIIPVVLIGLLIAVGIMIA
jgi:hypothetical protein